MVPKNITRACSDITAIASILQRIPWKIIFKHKPEIAV